MLCLKKTTLMLPMDVAHYNFNVHQPILVIFGRDVPDRVCYRMMICYPTSPNLCLCITWGNMNPENCVFSVMLGIQRDHPHRRIEMKFCTVAEID